MDTLQVGQVVALELDGGGVPLGCVVTELAGETATLVHTGFVAEDVIERLAAGSPGFLVVSEGPAVLGWRGAAITMPDRHPLIDFVVTDAHG